MSVTRPLHFFSSGILLNMILCSCFKGCGPTSGCKNKINLFNYVCKLSRITCTKLSWDTSKRNANIDEEFEGTNRDKIIFAKKSH